MPWFDVWQDGDGNTIELFYQPTPQADSYEIDSARAINNLPTDVQLVIASRNDDGSIGGVKFRQVFPPGSLRNLQFPIPAGTFSITPLGNPGSGQFTWGDAVSAGPVPTVSTPVKKP